MDKTQIYPEFSAQFAANMDALDFCSPNGGFTSFSAAVTSGSAMTQALNTLAPNASYQELQLKLPQISLSDLEQECLAKEYVAAVIASIALAATHSLECGMSATELASFQRRHGLEFEQSLSLYAKNAHFYAPKQLLAEAS
ncbi:hypothetical protein [Vibrio sp. SCSIO 43136]|uniref:hypothetical protein n=1 Tax=Vibrio sp. SCSIO 43136 TaxID=2819101 RepID=UPI002075BAF8|nr:hypothetical protein [Vibrio sp. SCSIO 43136]USD64495.1 hypothetical protein J4N39_10310 [Vibrio sp. SCSIO 43136]